MRRMIRYVLALHEEDAAKGLYSPCAYTGDGTLVDAKFLSNTVLAIAI